MCVCVFVCLLGSGVVCACVPLRFVCVVFVCVWHGVLACVCVCLGCCGFVCVPVCMCVQLRNCSMHWLCACVFDGVCLYGVFMCVRLRV